VDGPIGNFLTPGTVVWASNSTTVALEAAFRKLPVLVQAAEDDVDLCPLQGLPGVVNVRTVSDVAAALAAPKAPGLPPDYLALDPELPRWKERLGL
jgi:surface carbohydrate biosynthesis protein (TIGR04326 family)